MTIDEQIGALDAELAGIKTQLDRIEETLVRSEGVITTVASEVKPTIDALISHPLLRGFFGGKKK